MDVLALNVIASNIKHQISYKTTCEKFVNIFMLGSPKNIFYLVNSH